MICVDSFDAPVTGVTASYRDANSVCRGYDVAAALNNRGSTVIQVHSIHHAALCLLI